MMRISGRRSQDKMAPLPMAPRPRGPMGVVMVLAESEIDFLVLRLGAPVRVK